MKALFVSDLHAHNHEQFATTLANGRNSRFQAILNVLEEVRFLCQEHEVDAVFFLGDMFHSRTKVDVDVFGATWNAWRDIAAEVKHLYILIGNHDQYNKVGSVHSLEPFRDFATVIDQPMIERVEGVLFAAHPFTTNMKQWHRFVEMLPSNLDLFLFHQGICEAATGAFNISIKAEVSYSDMPLAKAQWCLGGHYHKPQAIGEEKRVLYIGSPLQHGFGERTEKKSVVLFDSGENLLHRIFTVAPGFDLFDDEGAFEASLLAGYDPTRCYVRVRTDSQLAADQIKKDYPSVQVEMIGKQEFEERRVSTDVVSSDRTLLEAYVKLTESKLDHQRLESFGLEMLAGDQA
jgi:DNA repair exonuclease SbcCD nuclease subunit